MAYPVSQLKVVATEGSLTAAEYNAEFQNVYQNVGRCQNIDDYSATVTEMQTMVDPGEVGSESQPTTIAGEIERLRYAIRDTKQKIDPSITHWYETPASFTLGSQTNTDTFTVYAQSETFDQTVLLVQCDSPSTETFKFIECINDANGTPDTVFEIDQDGATTIDGVLTVNANMTVNGDVTFSGNAGLSGSEYDIMMADGSVLSPGTSGLPLVAQGAGASPVYGQLEGDFIGATIASASADRVANVMSSTGANDILEATTSGHAMPAASANKVRQLMTKVDSGASSGLGNVAKRTHGDIRASTSWDTLSGSATITTSGKPVMIVLQPDGTSSSAEICVRDTQNGGEAKGDMRLLRNDSAIAYWFFEHDTASSSRPFDDTCFPGCLVFVDTVGAGTYTYKWQGRIRGSGDQFWVSNVASVVFELT
jgi:hypothetical protein